MTLVLIGDAQKAVSDYLRDHPSIVALGARVVGHTPPTKALRETAWVRVTRLDANPNGRDTADHLISYLTQFDCYAGADGGLPEANLLGRTVRAVLRDLAFADHDDIVFTGCRITGDASIPDTDGFEPARDRTILTAALTGHAVPG